MWRLLFAIAAFGVISDAAKAEAPVDGILSEARAACESFEGGSFDPGNAVTDIDLTGDGAADILVDESAFSCTSAASMYCGSGGCMLHAVVGDRVESWQATGWQVIDWGQARILLIGRDGGWCGGAGSQACFEALNWSDGRFLTVMPGQPEPASATAPYSTEDFDATTMLPCSLDEPTQDQSCPAGILRGAAGEATIRVTAPDGVERVLEFSAEGAIASPGTDGLTWAKDGDNWYVGIGGREYYIVPEAAVFGG
ncbi:hypothetical protein OEW28_03190 [Defluviimonas sp. WL0002]|uniref:Alkaline proteinase inhibitor/ Outer membrane lipoprotein Omp19 domain-containing protein n=1 Tax=Albidovulum marisflavi TaxID=2984159 RepID=A0ABT2Z921_9RHOB|nr:hypothetical protein [Defluviimonas sp. WL0002]MCV2867629.1 hypothetical protein [Defluviimonas sp. WL0002]